MTGKSKSIFTRRPAGFTLLETVTVIAIFSLTVTAVLNIYLIFFKNESQVERQITAMAGAHLILDSMQYALDSASVDYDYYSGAVPVNPAVLALITPQHTTIRFRYNAVTQVVEMCADRPANSPCNDLDPSMWVPLNDVDSSSVDSYRVWVAPSQNPFERLSDEQPRVTVVLHVTDHLGENPLTFQTTFTSRAYER